MFGNQETGMDGLIASDRWRAPAQQTFTVTLSNGWNSEFDSSTLNSYTDLVPLYISPPDFLLCSCYDH